MGFALVWQLTLLTLAIVPLMAVAGGTYTVILSSLSKKGEEAYAEAGKVAEEVNVGHTLPCNSVDCFISYLIWISKMTS